jgi:hypothetical protein
MRQLTAALALASACILAACGSTGGKPTATPKAGAGTTTTTSAAPVAVGDLDGLLLSTDQINTVMSAKGMTVNWSGSTLADDSAKISDTNCLAVAYPGELPVYTSSGWTALREQVLQQPGDKFTEYADQAVVLFPAAADAAAFFTGSTTKWKSCANSHYTYTPQGQSPGNWTVGGVSSTGGTLTARRTQEGSNGWNCQRALTVRNNVVIDANGCSYNQGDFGVNIAKQIAAKVAKL